MLFGSVLNSIMTIANAVIEEGEKGHGEAGNALEHVLDKVVIHLPTVMGVDLSITYHTMTMWAATALLLIVLPWVFGKRRMIPSGLGNALEAIVVFLREDIIYNYLGKDGKRYEIYLLTVFFFIVTNNLLGLVPGGASATGDISVTVTLTLITFGTVVVSGMKKYGIVGFWTGMVPSGIPVVLVPLMFLIEILGLLAKHFALAMRLFANMTAGHLTILSLIGLVFTFKSYFIAPFPIIGAVAVSILEILVAFLQAYIFTLLSTVYISMALHQDH